MSSDGGIGWTHTFNGALQGDYVVGKYFDHPPGAARGSAELSILIVHPGRLEKVRGTGGGFGGSVWTRDISGTWRADDGGSYTIKQSGLQVAWEGVSGDGGRSWIHTFNGARQGDSISGKWLDHRTRGGGELSVLVIDGKRLEKVPGTGEGFGANVWSR